MRVEECRICGLTKYGSMTDGMCSDCLKDDEVVLGIMKAQIDEMHACPNCSIRDGEACDKHKIMYAQTLGYDLPFEGTTKDWIEEESK